MCNRARNSSEPEMLRTNFGTVFGADRPMDNRFNPVELMPRNRAYVIREEEGRRGLDITNWIGWLFVLLLTRRLHRGT